MKKALPVLALMFLMGLLVWGLGHVGKVTPATTLLVREGGDFIRVGDMEAAQARFAAALEETPQHRGALMGQVIVHLNTGRDNEAEGAVMDLIDLLEKDAADGDGAAFPLLAAAHANLGILFDRTDRTVLALEHYDMALQMDEETVAQQDWTERLFGLPFDRNAVRARADYIRSQLELPKSERLLVLPDPPGPTE